VESAYFVVARRGKNPSARSSSARRRALPRRSQLEVRVTVWQRLPLKISCCLPRLSEQPGQLIALLLT
jgi:hypothetical protein